MVLLLTAGAKLSIFHELTCTNVGGISSPSQFYIESWGYWGYRTIKSEGPSSVCASCTSFNVVQLDWSLMCRQNGLNNSERSSDRACGEASVFLFLV